MCLSSVSMMVPIISPRTVSVNDEVVLKNEGNPPYSSMKVLIGGDCPSRIPLPATITDELSHAICATGLENISAIGIGSDNSTKVTYDLDQPFASGMLAWGDRRYIVTNVEGSPCEGGMYLRPSKGSEIPRGTEITITYVPYLTVDAKICVMFNIDDPEGGFHGDFPSSAGNI